MRVLKRMICIDTGDCDVQGVFLLIILMYMVCIDICLRLIFMFGQYGCLWLIYGYLSEKVSFWLFKIFKIQKGRTFSFNDILRLCTIVVNIAIRSRA